MNNENGGSPSSSQRSDEVKPTVYSTSVPPSVRPVGDLARTDHTLDHAPNPADVAGASVVMALIPDPPHHDGVTHREPWVDRFAQR